MPNPNEFVLPIELIEQMKMHAESNNCGMSACQHSGVTIILIGPSVYSPQEIAIMSAWLLLDGVIDGSLMDSNLEALKLKEQMEKGKAN